MYEYAAKNFGTLSFLFLVLESDDLEKAKQYAHQLEPRILKHKKFVKRVYYQYDFEIFLNHLFYYLDQKELTELEKFLRENQEEIKNLRSKPGLVNLLSLLDHSLAQILSRGEIPEEQLKQINLFQPLEKIFNFFQESLEGKEPDINVLKKELAQSLTQTRFASLRFNPLEPYIISQDRKHLLFLIAPPMPVDDFELATEFVDTVNKELAQLDKEMPGVRHYLTGNAAVMRDDNIIVRQDMLRTTLIAFFLIMLLFAYSFRNLSSIAFAGLCLGIGLLWAFGTAYLMVGYLTIITAVFGAILLGLGIDYAILVLSRYTEERHRGHTIKESLDITLTQTGKGIITGATATSLAFYSIASGSFRGGKEMGLISGTGIIIFVIVMLLILSSLLVFWDARSSLKAPVQKKFDPKIMKLLSRLVTRFPIPLFSIFALFFAGMVYLLPRYQFEYNYLNMEPQNVESVQLIRKIPKWFGISTNFGMILSNNIAEDRKLVRELQQKETVAMVDAISHYLPEFSPEKEKTIKSLYQLFLQTEPTSEPEIQKLTPGQISGLIELLNSLEEKFRGIEGLAFLSDLEEIEAQASQSRTKLKNLIELLQKQSPQLSAQNLKSLNQMLGEKVPKFFSRAQEIAQAPAPDFQYLQKHHPEIVERYQGRDGKFLIYAYPNREIWNEENMKAVVRDLKSVSPQAMGVAVLFNRILDQLKKDLLKVGVIAFCVVFVVILLSYRNLSYTLLTMLPLLFGSVAMVGIMNLLGIKFNFVNIGMVPLIIGISIDYGIYVIQRWLGEGKGKNAIPKIVISTGRAVSLSALTTMIGFGSIILARWKGLSIMGKTLVIGVGCALISAVVMLPCLLTIIEQIKSKNQEKKEKLKL